jgi:hypothetical protein
MIEDLTQDRSFALHELACIQSLALLFRVAHPKATVTAAASGPIADVQNGSVYDFVAHTASKRNLSAFMTSRPQSRRDEDTKVDLEEINLLRR